MSKWKKAPIAITDPPDDDFVEDNVGNDYSDEEGDCTTGMPEPPPLPAIPPLRTFRLYRWEARTSQLTETLISAHGMTNSENGNVLSFIVYAIEGGKPSAFMRQSFNGWDRVEEVLTVPVTTGLAH